jgi:hypothetical protein
MRIRITAIILGAIVPLLTTGAGMSLAGDGPTECE